MERGNQVGECLNGLAFLVHTRQHLSKLKG